MLRQASQHERRRRASLPDPGVGKGRLRHEGIDAEPGGRSRRPKEQRFHQLVQGGANLFTPPG